MCGEILEYLHPLKLSMPRHAVFPGVWWELAGLLVGTSRVVDGELAKLASRSMAPL